MAKKSHRIGGEIKSLEALCARITSRAGWPHGNAWVGDVSDIRQSKVPVMLAQKLGFEPTDAHEFHPISVQKAAQILAYLCRESLAYGRWHFRRAEAIALEKMLIDELGPSARFWSSNPGEHLVEVGKELKSSYSTGIPLSSATFEFGVIGSNQTRGFIFWVEDED